mmetsp:Transcript_30463/g.78944  ORF Transcript_30463/g.78944 Transcript_30463/m.78944 type:complete len:84 (+) Transcript_30463:2180-2431(+)
MCVFRFVALFSPLTTSYFLLPPEWKREERVRRVKELRRLRRSSAMKKNGVVQIKIEKKKKRNAKEEEERKVKNVLPGGFIIKT